MQMKQRTARKNYWKKRPNPSAYVRLRRLRGKVRFSRSVAEGESVTTKDTENCQEHREHSHVAESSAWPNGDTRFELIFLDSLYVPYSLYLLVSIAAFLAL